MRLADPSPPPAEREAPFPPRLMNTPAAGHPLPQGRRGQEIQIKAPLRRRRLGRRKTLLTPAAQRGNFGNHFVGACWSQTRLVKITLTPVGGNPRLRRPLCGKASPFRGNGVPNNSLRAGWKAEPSSRRGGRKDAAWAGKPEAFRTAGGRAALRAGTMGEIGQPCSPADTHRRRA